MGENLPSYFNLVDCSTPGERFNAVLQKNMQNLNANLRRFWYFFRGAMQKYSFEYIKIIFLTEKLIFEI